MADTKIGGAYVELEARGAEKMRAEIDKSKSSLRSFAEETNKGLGRQVELFTSLLGKVTAVVGVFGTFVAIGRTLRGVFDRLTGSVERFSDSLVIDAQNPVASLKQIEAAIASLESQLAKAQEEGLLGDAERFLFGSTAGELRAQLEDARNQADGVRQQIRARQRQEQREDADRAAQTQADALRRSIAEQRINLLAPDDQEIARLTQSLRAAQAVVSEGQTQLIRELAAQLSGTIEQQIANIRAEQAAQRAALEEDERIKNEAAEARGRAEAQAYADELKRQLDSIREAQVGAFGADRLTTSVNAIQQQINALLLQRGR